MLSVVFDDAFIELNINCKPFTNYLVEVCMTERQWKIVDKRLLYMSGTSIGLLGALAYSINVNKYCICNV